MGHRDRSRSACWHRPVIVRDMATKLGDVIGCLKVAPERPDDDVIDNDLILVWGSQRRIITGSDLLGSPITRHCDFGAKEAAKPRVTWQVGLSLPRERYPRNRAWKPHERQSRRLPQGPRKRTKIEHGCMALPYLEQTCRWREPNLHGELSERFWSLQSRIPRFNRAGRMSALGGGFN